jgi:hypothetical protein
LNDYVTEDEMYNFQVWGVSNDILGEITQKILEQLSNIAPLEQPFLVKALPKTYVMGVNNDTGIIALELHNSDQVVNGYFTVLENANEKSAFQVNKNIPFTMSAMSNSIIKLPVSDVYESSIKMYIKDSLVDEIFISDGAWDVNYVAANTVLNKFEIMNDPKRLIRDEYPVYRNIHLEASTNTYISAYKLLRGGGMPKDLTGYKTFKFTAAANSPLNITMVKSSVKNWDDQYSIRIPITTDEKEYLIDLNDFISTSTKDKINPNDINSIVFSLGSTNGALANINASLSNISFSKESLSSIEALKLKTITVFPNPTNGKFQCVFSSDKAMVANLMITDAYSGIKIFTKSISIEMGENIVPIDITSYYQKATGGTCIISIKNSETTYSSQKLIIFPN